MLQLHRSYSNTSQNDMKMCINKISQKFNISEKDILQILTKSIIPKTLVNGPTDCIKFTNLEYHKTVYVFGENHNIYQNVPYMHISEFMTEVLDTHTIHSTHHSNDPIHIYVELPLDQSELLYPKYTSAKSLFESDVVHTSQSKHLPLIYNTLRSYPNTHYSDIRFSDKLKPYLYLYLDLQELRGNISLYRKDYVFELMNRFKTLFPVDMNDILYGTGITQIVNNISSHYIKNTIIQYFYNMFNKYNFAWTDVYKDLLSFYKFSNNQYITDMYLPYVVAWLNLFVDYYIIASIFNDNIHYAIVYVGRTHMLSFIDIFQSLNFQMTYSDKDPDSITPDLTKFIPLFS